MQARSFVAPRRYSQLPRFFRWFSDHCVLRQVDESDVSRLMRAAAHPATPLCSTVPMPATHGAAQEMVLEAHAHWLRGTRYAMAVLRKQTHDFVGWIEVAPHAREKGAWQLDVFVQQGFANLPIAVETVTAAADLMFSALGAACLYASCPSGATRADELFNEAGFIEIAPAAAPDSATGQGGTRSVLELGRDDWIAMRRAQCEEAGQAETYVSNWVSSGMRDDLVLL